MKKLVLFLLAVLSCNGRNQYELLPNQKLIQEGIDRAVSVEGSSEIPYHQEWTCSGAVLETGRVLTAAHCVGQTTTVNGNPAYVLKSNADMDIALLFTYTKPFPKLELNTNPKISDRIFLVGDPTGIRVVMIGRIIKVSDKLVALDILDGHGSSGGAVYDSYGRLVGLQILIRTDGQAFVFAAATSAKNIQEILQ